MRDFKDLKIAVAGTGYVGLSIATLLSQHHKVTAVDIVPEKVELINNKKSPIQDEYIEKYLAEKELDLTATLDAKEAYSDADFVVIAALTNYDSKKNFFDASAVEVVIKLVIEQKLDVPKQSFMERPIDCKAGHKHHVTNGYLKHLQKSLMDICMRENLNQIDLLSPSLSKVSEQEYYAKRCGQINLDLTNLELLGDGFTPAKTTFETEKEKIRNAITDIAKRSASFMDFQNLLKLEYGILVKDHRGRFSYLPADREKFISARTLGTSFDREHLLLLFQCNAAEKEKQQCRVNDPMDALYIKSNLRLVVNLQDCVKAQQSYAYAQKVKISNLQKMAHTVLYVQEHGYDSYEKLYEAAESIDRKMATARSDAKLTEVKLKKVNEQIHHLGQYFSTKSVYSEFLKAPNKKIFRQTHFDEIAKYEEARQFLKRDFLDEKFPSMKDLRAEKELLMCTKDARYETYHYFKERNTEIQTVLANVDSILEMEKLQQREQRPRAKKRSYDMSL